jgi:hypothetical protein
MHCMHSCLAKHAVKQKETNGRAAGIPAYNCKVAGSIDTYCKVSRNWAARL